MNTNIHRYNYSVLHYQDVTGNYIGTRYEWQLRVSAYKDGENVIGDDIRTIERYAQLLLNACNDSCQAENAMKSKYMETENLRVMIANEHTRIGRY